MRLEHPFCVFGGHFSEAFCDAVTALGESLDSMQGQVASDPEKNLRDSTVAWIPDTPETHWLYEQMTDFVHETNRLYWGWEIGNCESMQYTNYGPQQFYTWHADQRRKPYDEKSRWPGLVRKISISILLSDGAEYDGGNFVIEDLQSPPHVPEKRFHVLDNARAQGSAVVFPSHLYHRVNPVKSGKRRSLVAWFLGPPFV